MLFDEVVDEKQALLAHDQLGSPPIVGLPGPRPLCDVYGGVGKVLLWSWCMGTCRRLRLHGSLFGGNLIF